LFVPANGGTSIGGILRDELGMMIQYCHFKIDTLTVVMTTLNYGIRLGLAHNRSLKHIIFNVDSSMMHTFVHIGNKLRPLFWKKWCLVVYASPTIQLSFSYASPYRWTHVVLRQWHPSLRHMHEGCFAFNSSISSFFACLVSFNW